MKPTDAQLKASEMKNPTPNGDPTSHEEMEISHVAFDLWQRAGRPTGQYIEYWERAKKQVLATRDAPSNKSRPGESPKQPMLRQSRSAAHESGIPE